MGPYRSNARQPASKYAPISRWRLAKRFLRRAFAVVCGTKTLPVRLAIRKCRHSARSLTAVAFIVRGDGSVDEYPLDALSWSARQVLATRAVMYRDVFLRH